MQLPQQYVLQMYICTMEQPVHSYNATQEWVAQRTKQAKVAPLRLCLGVCITSNNLGVIVSC